MVSSWRDGSADPAFAVFFSSSSSPELLGAKSDRDARRRALQRQGLHPGFGANRLVRSPSPETRDEIEDGGSEAPPSRDGAASGKGARGGDGRGGGGREEQRQAAGGSKSFKKQSASVRDAALGWKPPPPAPVSALADLFDISDAKPGSRQPSAEAPMHAPMGRNQTKRATRGAAPAASIESSGLMTSAEIDAEVAELTQRAQEKVDGLAGKKNLAVVLGEALELRGSKSADKTRFATEIMMEWDPNRDGEISKMEVRGLLPAPYYLLKC